MCRPASGACCPTTGRRRSPCRGRPTGSATRYFLRVIEAGTGLDPAVKDRVPTVVVSAHNLSFSAGKGGIGVGTEIEWPADDPADELVDDG